uniref:Uncharacterized protein n=1 Tax=Heterorhabditis bacteriophora TaxID=37862 RepID=A0A1I7WTW8_HETBA
MILSAANMTVTNDKDTSSESCFEKSISLLGDPETANDGNESGEISDDSVVNDLEQRSVDRHRRRERAMEISVAWQDSLRSQTKPSSDRRARRQEIIEPKTYFDNSFYELPNDSAGNIVGDRLSPREIINRTNLVLAADGRNLVTVRDEELRALVSSAVQLLYEHDQLLESRLQLAKELRGIFEQEENVARSLLAEARVPNDLFSPLNSVGLHDMRSQVVPTAVDNVFKDITTMGTNDIGTSHILSHPYAARPPNTSVPPPNLTIPPPTSSDSCPDLTVPPPPVGTVIEDLLFLNYFQLILFMYLYFGIICIFQLCVNDVLLLF